MIYAPGRRFPAAARGLPDHRYHATARREKGARGGFFRSSTRNWHGPGPAPWAYNSLRFDDEVTRYGLYRNFSIPTRVSGKNGNSRWDMIDVVRLTRALRPEGIDWRRRNPA